MLSITQQKPISLPIVVIGKQSCGKTSLINSILGFKIGLVRGTRATTTVIVVKCKQDLSQELPTITIKAQDVSGTLEFPFYKSMENIMKALERFNESFMELNVSWRGFSHDFTIIDCPGYKENSDENKMENSKIISSIRYAINIFSPCIILYCFSSATYGATGQIMRELKLNSKNSHLLPVFTKVEVAKMDNAVDYLDILKHNYLAHIQLSRVWLTESPLLPRTVTDLAGEITFYKNSLLKQTEQWKAFKEEIDREKGTEQYSRIESVQLFYGIESLTKVFKEIDIAHNRKFKENLQNTLARLQSELDIKSSTTSTNCIEKMAIHHHYLDMIKLTRTTLAFFSNDTALSVRKRYDKIYGSTIAEELAQCSESEIDQLLKDLIHDTNNGKKTGLHQLERDYQWIEYVIDSLPIELILAHRQSSNSEESFKKKRKGSMKCILLFEDEVITSLADNSEILTKIFKAVQQFHLQKINLILVETMRNSILESKLSGKLVSKLYAQTYIILLNKYSYMKEKEFSSYLDSLFQEGEYANDITSIKSFLTYEGFQILEQMRSLNSDSFIIEQAYPSFLIYQ